MNSRRFIILVALALALPSRAVLAQETSTTSAAEPEADEIVELSPFQVSASSDSGYAARETLAGSRLKTELKDVPSQISVMTEEFLADIATVSLDDAYRYSLNVENTTEFVSATAGTGDFATGVVNIYENSRVRGLASAGRTHDFFTTNVPGDAYNTERFTFSSGPNSILFGNGNPAGIVDTAFKRANVSRSQYSVSFRFDDQGSWRTALDANAPIIRDKLAIRLAAVKSETDEWRDPAGEQAERVYGTVTFRPFEATTVRAYYEDASIDRITARQTRAYDRVTPWIEAGRPTFNNGLTGTNPNPSASDPLFARNTQGANVVVYGAGEPVDMMVWGAAGTSTAASVRYSVQTKGPGRAPYQVGVDSYDYSLLDTSVSPEDISISGTGSRNRVDAEIMGAILEQRIGKNLFIELGYNREEIINPVTDLLRGGDTSLMAEVNQYLPDRVTPNPNLGRYYVEASGRARMWMRKNEEARVMASYDLDLTQHNKWLGRHRFALMYQRSDSIAGGQDALLRRVAPGVEVTEENIASLPATTFSNVRLRMYLSDPASPQSGNTYYFDPGFDPFKPHVLPDDSTLYSVINPWNGATQQVTVDHTLLEGRVLAMNNRFLDGRLVTTFGWRSDKVRNVGMPTQRIHPTYAYYESILRTKVSSDWANYLSGETFTGGAVLHVAPWASVFYNTSSTWNPPRTGSHYPDGSTIPGSTGDGHDYGIMLRFLENRVSLRFNKYENTSGPDLSSYRNAILGGFIPIEETIFDAAEDGTIATYVPYGSFDPKVSNIYYYDVTSDRVSEGYEVELTANPSRQLRLAVNVAKAEATESNIGTPWFKFFEDRIDYWSQNSELTGPSSDGATTMIRDRVIGVISTLNQMKQSDGQRVEQGREWRANLVARYSFDEGPLKGSFVGGGYRWRSKGVIGYEATTIPNEYDFPGVPQEIVVQALDAPIYGKDTHEVEAFIGYSGRLFEKVSWRVQLNVRNLFDDQEWVAQRANTSGTETLFNVPSPRTYVLTTSFTF